MLLYSFDSLWFIYKRAHLCEMLFSVSFYLQLGANGYAYAINHNGFVVFHPGLRLIQVRNSAVY